MRITLIIATSLNGKITMGDNADTAAWTSAEDTKFFRSRLEKAKLIVMGKGTYEVMKSKMIHRPGRLRVVFTHYPEKYNQDEISGQLEFTRASVSQCVNTLAKRGFGKMLLVSGTEITTEFFKAGLVNEVYQTMEPYIFTNGKNMIGNVVLNKKLKLLSIHKLNNKGTLLLHYKILN